MKKKRKGKKESWKGEGPSTLLSPFSPFLGHEISLVRVSPRHLVPRVCVSVGEGEGEREEAGCLKRGGAVSVEEGDGLALAHAAGDSSFN